MESDRNRPVEIARRLGARRDLHSRKAGGRSDAWLRETFTLPRDEARQAARDWFNRYPKAAYASEIEFWRELDDGRIEFTMRRFPSAD